MQSFEKFFNLSIHITSIRLRILQQFGSILHRRENYYVRALEMKREMATKNKYNFVEVLIKIFKENDLSFVTWERCNNLVHSLIIDSTTQAIAERIVLKI